MQTILVFTSGTMSLPRKIAGIQRFARQRNWNVQQIAAPATSAKVRRLIDFWRPAGCIVEASGGLKLGPKPFADTPVVFLDQDPAIVAGDAPLVRHDPAAIAALAAKELMTIAKHYAFIDWFTPIYWAADKRVAFREILDLHGHPCHIFTPPPSDHARPLAFQKRLRQWVARLPVPCGIFAVNDSLGAAVIAAAAACGRAIPEDISVVGVDDDEAVCENTHPTMSSILPDFEGTGYRAAELLSKLIDNSRTHPRTIELMPPLRVVRRQSTRLFAETDAKVAEAVEYIRLHVTSDIRACDVAGLFPCSRRLAEIRFRRVTGRSFLDEIAAVRMERTFDLLRRSDVAISAVADLCGWPSVCIFHRRFKALTGLAPGTWRRQNTPA